MATRTSHFNISTEFLLVALLTLFLVASGRALAQMPFYQSKTITLIQGTAARGVFRYDG